MTNRIRNPHLPEGCCVPFRRPWPSGIAWTHSGHCTVDPNQKFKPGQAQELKEHSRAHMYAREAAKLNLKAVGLHPECIQAAKDGEVVCSFCSPKIAPSEYDLDHSDDHDDREAEFNA
jgi:hypothetical protein